MLDFVVVPRAGLELAQLNESPPRRRAPPRGLVSDGAAVPWNGPDSFDEKAPFNAWEQIDVYDSATDCSRYRVKDIEINGKSGLVLLQSDVGRDAKSVRNRLGASRCIATDDPRLKEK